MRGIALAILVSGVHVALAIAGANATYRVRVYDAAILLLLWIAAMSCIVMGV